jgi:hypothetical protein
LFVNGYSCGGYSCGGYSCGGYSCGGMELACAGRKSDTIPDAPSAQRHRLAGRE